jgi:hypothetical protein
VWFEEKSKFVIFLLSSFLIVFFIGHKEKRLTSGAARSKLLEIYAKIDRKHIFAPKTNIGTGREFFVPTQKYPEIFHLLCPVGSSKKKLRKIFLFRF